MGRTDDLAHKELELKIENEDKKEDSQRYMTWVALSFLMFFPIIAYIGIYFLPSGEDFVRSIATIWIPATAAIVMTFFGAEAYAKRR